MPLPSVNAFRAATGRTFGLRRFSGLTKIDGLLGQWERNQQSNSTTKMTILNALVDAVHEFGNGLGVTVTADRKLRYRHPRDPRGAVYALSSEALQIMAAMPIDLDDANNHAAPPMPVAANGVQAQRLGRPANTQPTAIRGMNRPPTHVPAPPTQGVYLPAEAQDTVDDDFTPLLANMPLYYTTNFVQMMAVKMASVRYCNREEILELQRLAREQAQLSESDFMILARTLAGLGGRCHYRRACTHESLIEAMKGSSLGSPIIVCVGSLEDYHLVPLLVMGRKFYRDEVNNIYEGFQIADARGTHIKNPSLYRNGIYCAENIVGMVETWKIIPESGYIYF